MYTILRKRNKRKDGNVIISHGDTDGIMSALLADVFLTKITSCNNEIIIDLNPKEEATDEMLMRAFDKAGDNDIFNVVVADRHVASVATLNNLHFKNLMLCDHHVTSETSIDEVEAECDKRVFTYFNTNMCATWGIYESLIKNTSLDNSAILATAILTDAWDTFKWTKVSSMTDVEVEKFIIDTYLDGDHSKFTNELKSMILPYDKNAIGLNMAFMFEDSKYIFEAMKESLANGKMLQGYEAVSNRYARSIETTVNKLNREFSYRLKHNDVVKLNIPSIAGDRDVIVFMPNTKMELETSSIVSHNFLVTNPNVVLLYNTSDVSNLFSLRSTGDLDATPIAKIFGGGGHKNACGFKHKGLDEPIQFLKDSITSTVALDIKRAFGDVEGDEKCL